MAKKRLFSASQHASHAVTLGECHDDLETLLLLIAEHYGPLDNLTDLAIQARKGVERLRSELHRRYVLQGLHKPLNLSPYYPKEKVADADAGMAPGHCEAAPAAGGSDGPHQLASQVPEVPAAGPDGGGGAAAGPGGRAPAST